MNEQNEEANLPEPEWLTAWRYWEPDGEWRLWHTEDKDLAVIYEANHAHPAVGLRVCSGATEIEFPNVEDAMFFGYAAVHLFETNRRKLTEELI
jgi:hypothetical protein